MENEKQTQVRNLEELYTDKSLYSSKDMFSPPAERLNHAIRFELTRGCNWGKCTYCGGFDGVKHRIKDLTEYKAHVDGVWERIGKNSPLAKSLTRIFIGGGNALEVETDALNEAIQYTEKKFKENTRQYPQRTALYGRTDAIVKQGTKGLIKLANGTTNVFKRIFGTNHGLDLIYWGVESGSSNVLDYVQKGCKQEDIIEAAKILNARVGVTDIRRVNLSTSVMIMPGLGGIRFYDEHIRETAKVLGLIKPKYLTFMGASSAENSPYAKRMQKEIEAGTNRPLTDFELSSQMIEIIKSMPAFDTNIGCFGTDVDKVGHNPLTFMKMKLNTYNLDENKKENVKWLVDRTYREFVHPMEDI